MAGETIKTRGIVLDIRPWSRTSHVVTWLTEDHGPVVTMVRGAVRPKSAFLGQYDFFYTCELVYYARSRGEIHAMREVAPIVFREGLRGDWRAFVFASYAAQLMKDHCPHGVGTLDWFQLFGNTLDGVCRRGGETRKMALGRALVDFEMAFLRLAGLEPDFSGADDSASENRFSIDSGRIGSGERMVLLPSPTLACLSGKAVAPELDTLKSALRFLGLFLRYHLGISVDTRRSVTQIVFD